MLKSTSQGIDLDSYLDYLSDCLYDELMNRVDFIKFNYQKQFVKIGAKENGPYDYSVKISNDVSSWLSLGNFLIKLNEANKFVSCQNCFFLCLQFY